MGEIGRPELILVLVILVLLVASTRLPKVAKGSNGAAASDLQKGFEDLGAPKPSSKKKLSD